MTYEVGRGKPPEYMRFQKGTSGNPKGRPKKVPMPEGEIFKAIQNEIIEYTVNGKRRKAPRIEVLIRKLAADAMQGDVLAAQKLMKLDQHARKYGDINPLVLYLDEEDRYV